MTQRTRFWGAARLTAALAMLVGPALVLIGVAGPAAGAARSFSLRYGINAWGNVEQAGNTLETCPASDGRCAANQTGGGKENNNVFAMRWVDTDSDADTFDSSSARVSVPPGATVSFAGLYWGGDLGTPRGNGRPNCSTVGGVASAPRDADRARYVQLRLGNGAYRPVQATTLDTVPATTGGEPYQGFSDITTLFAPYDKPSTLTAVPVTVADVQLAQGQNCNGGWSIVLAYTYPTGTDPSVSPSPTYAPVYRNISVFDGLVNQGSTSPPQTIRLDGFVTPQSGAVDATVGVVAYEGDRNTTKDRLTLNGTALSDPTGGTDNFFDSAVAGGTFAVPETTLPGTGPVDPVYRNALGYDSKAVAVPEGVIPAGATSLDATLSTTGDAYLPGAFVFTSRIQPYAELTKTVTRASDGENLSGRDVAAGDRIRYTLTARGIGTLPVDNTSVSDPYPDGISVVPGSLTLDGRSLTDGADGDAGELGARAATVDLGTLAPGRTHTVTFDATIDADAPAGVPIVNAARLAYRAAGSRFARSAQVEVVPDRIDLAVAKTADPTSAPVDGDTEFTVRITNQSKTTATGVVVTDTLGRDLSTVTARVSKGRLRGGTWRVGTLAGGAEATLHLEARIEAPGTRTNSAEVTAADQPDRDSVPGDGTGDDHATATVTGTLPANTADLTTGPIRPADPTPTSGGTYRITIPVVNHGPNPATSVVVRIHLPARLTPVSLRGDGWTCQVRGLTCRRTRIVADAAAAPIALVVRSHACVSGPARITATVTSGVTDPKTGNDTTAGTLTLRSGCTHSPGAAPPGGGASGHLPVTGLTIGLLAALVTGVGLVVVGLLLYTRWGLHRHG